MVYTNFALQIAICMKVYFYHDQNINQMYREWKSGRYPGHFLFGATHLHKYGIDVIMHQHRQFSSNFKLCLYVAWQILTCREPFDVVYAANTKGLGLIMALHSMHVFRKPIVAWQKQPVMGYDLFSKTQYNGLDKVIFMSRQIADESVRSGAFESHQVEVVNWGCDLDYYDKLMFFNNEYSNNHNGFISTGKDRRDMATLVRAFSATGQPLQIYVASQAYGDNYLATLNDLRPSSNINVTFLKGNMTAELAQKVWQSRYVVICCQESNEPVGYTTLMEAMALGLPVICSRNSTYPLDVESEGIGVTIPFYDSVGWENAIRTFVANPDQTAMMGKAARRLAESSFNLEKCTKDVASILLKYRTPVV